MHNSTGLPLPAISTSKLLALPHIALPARNRNKLKISTPFLPHICARPPVHGSIAVPVNANADPTHIYAPGEEDLGVFEWLETFSRSAIMVGRAVDIVVYG